MSNGGYCNEGSECTSGRCLVSRNECVGVDYTCVQNTFALYDRCGGQPCNVFDDCASYQCNDGVCELAEYDVGEPSASSEPSGSTCNSTPFGWERCNGVSCGSGWECESSICSGFVCADAIEWDVVEDALQAWAIAVMVIGIIIFLSIIGCIVCCCVAAGICCQKASKKSSSSSSDSDKTGTKAERKARKKAKKQRKEMEKQMQAMQVQMAAMGGAQPMVDANGNVIQPGMPMQPMVDANGNVIQQPMMMQPMVDANG